MILGVDYFWDFYEDTVAYLSKYGHARVHKCALRVKYNWQQLSQKSSSKSALVKRIDDLIASHLLERGSIALDTTPLQGLLLAQGWKVIHGPTSGDSPLRSKILVVPWWNADRIVDESSSVYFDLDKDFFAGWDAIVNYLKVIDT